MAAVAADVVRSVQTILKGTTAPNLRIDGIVGDRTVAAFAKAESHVRRVISDFTNLAGYDATRLLAPLKREPVTTSPAPKTQTFGAAPRPAAKIEQLPYQPPKVTRVTNLTPQAAWLRDLVPAAVAESARSGHSAALILAQAALESNWGRSTSVARANNIFGIKADKSWTGERWNMVTREVRNGVSVMENAAWRVYKTVGDALKDRTAFLRGNPRYASAGLFAAGTLGNAIKEAQALLRAGYATDPAYVTKITSVLNGQTLRNGLAAAGYKLTSAYEVVRDGPSRGQQDLDKALKAAESVNSSDNILMKGLKAIAPVRPMTNREASEYIDDIKSLGKTLF